MELTLVRLREEDMSFVYFWVESYNDEVVSPTFESEEDAHLWADALKWKLKKAIDKARSK